MMGGGGGGLDPVREANFWQTRVSSSVVDINEVCFIVIVFHGV